MSEPAVFLWILLALLIRRDVLSLTNYLVALIKRAIPSLLKCDVDGEFCLLCSCNFDHLLCINSDIC